MKEFENNALSTTDNPSMTWKRYVYDTFVIQNSQHENKFLQHINFIGKAIQFTAEDTRPDGVMPF